MNFAKKLTLVPFPGIYVGLGNYIGIQETSIDVNLQPFL